MFRFVVVIATLAAAVAFAPARFNARSQMTMAAEKNTFAKYDEHYLAPIFTKE
jgi:hypothetical protein